MDIEFLEDERLRAWLARLGYPADGAQALAETAAQVRADPALRAIFAAFHEKTAHRGEWHREWSDLPFDPAVQAAFGERVSLFYLLAYLSALPHTLLEYARRGIPQNIFWDTMTDIRRWYCHTHRVEGVWRFRQFQWIWRHLSPELFRLGRLQFMLIEFDEGVTALRRKSDGRILLLADPTLPLRADGFAYGAGQTGAEGQEPPPPAPGEAWLPVFEESAAGWRGNPVSPYGYVLKEEVFLPAAEWQPALRRGNTVLDLHIPPDDPFTVEDCRESMLQAHAFFARHAPGRPFKAAFCHTWFFTPQLQKLLPPESNLVRFQREFYLFPFAGGPGFLWSYVFGEQVQNPALAPRDTSLRRAVLDWLAAGGELFDLPGVAFHPPEAWGTQPYMGAAER